MARAIHKLTARAAETISKPGRHSDGGGLYLSISAEGRRRWVFLFTWRGRLREAGLGSASKGGVSLKAAREKAAEGRALVKAGVDPIAEWNKADETEVPTFGKTADDFLAAHEGGWRNDKHKAQWAMTLTRYCEPIRKMPVDAIDTEAVLSVLKPLWTRAPETASRLRGRIEADFGCGQGARLHRPQRSQPGALARPSRQAVAEARQADAGPSCGHALREVPAFVASLRERPTTAARALEFCILTAARSGEALAARWDEIDFAGKVWTVPPARTKAAREHRVPLSDRALAILGK